MSTTSMHVTMTATTFAATTATSKLSNSNNNNNENNGNNNNNNSNNSNNNNSSSSSSASSSSSSSNSSNNSNSDTCNKAQHSATMFNQTTAPTQATHAPTTNLIGSDITNNTPIISSNHGPPHYVDLHVNAGECISLQLLDGQEQVLTGPATITMISQQQNPPVPIPVQVPPGHMVHQIADENGTLKHIILSVMVNEENSHLNSAVINLPHGNFRINSLGELVNVGSDVANDRDSPNQLQDQASIAQATSSTNSSNAPTIHHLAQQQPTTTYFANYDSCPMANYDTTLAGYGAHHYSNQPTYNGIMTNSYHHDSTSPSSYKASPSLLSHPAPIMPVAPAAGSYPFAYSNFNQIQSHQAANVVLSASGKQANNHRKNAVTNGHQATSAYKVNDNENNLPRNKRGDLQVGAQNHLNGNVGPIHQNVNPRHQHNDINSKRQQQHLVGLDESNKYNSNLRTQACNQASSMNNSASGQHHHHHHNHHNRNFRSSGGGNNGPIVNSRVSRLRGSYNNHHHQNHSATPYSTRNNYNNFNGNTLYDTVSNLENNNPANIQSAKDVKPIDSTQSPNLSSPTSKQQSQSQQLQMQQSQSQSQQSQQQSQQPQQQMQQLQPQHKQQQSSSQKSSTVCKNYSSSTPIEDISVEENVSNVKRNDNRAGTTTKDINIKQKPDIDLENSEIVKCTEHMKIFESSTPPRNSRGKHKKCHDDCAKQSNEQTANKQSIDVQSKASIDSLRSRSVNEEFVKTTANGVTDNKTKIKSQKKNFSHQDNNRQSIKAANISESSNITESGDKIPKTLQAENELANVAYLAQALETKEEVESSVIIVDSMDFEPPIVVPRRTKNRDNTIAVIEKNDSSHSHATKAKPKHFETSVKTNASSVSNQAPKSESPSRKKSSSHHNQHHHHHHNPIKFSTFVKQCRNKFVTTLGTLVQNSLSSCSDTKFAGLLLVLFTVVAMLLAMIIHLYIV